VAINRVLVVIPTYNCHKQVVELLRDIHLQPLPDSTCLWFIDNLSTDGTFEVTTEFIDANKCKNIYSFQSMQNNNLGGTHKIGFNEAISQSYEYIAILHGDNQARYSDLVNIINRARKDGNVKSYLGSRFSRKSNLVGYSRKRFFGNIVLNFIYSTFKLKILTDLGSGLNLYRVADLRSIDYLGFGNSLTFNYELLLEMIDSDMPFEFIPIEWREVDQVSNAKNFSIFLAGIDILLRNKFHKRKFTPNNGRIYQIDLSQNG
jgi:dolichol-phosphate mannosyltransferase